MIDTGRGWMLPGYSDSVPGFYKNIEERWTQAQHRKRMRKIIAGVVSLVILLIAVVVGLYYRTDLFYSPSHDLTSDSGSGEWAMFRHDLLLSGSTAPDNDFSEGTVKWTFPTDGAIHSSVAVANGTVYFGTDKGLISYKGTAIEGKEFFDDVYVYPNPVREDYTGEIVITGLLADVNVKITDISGNIVYETTSLGGQAIWDGRTFSGNRVSTGVYLVFCTNEDGSMTHITKLLVIN